MTNQEVAPVQPVPPHWAKCAAPTAEEVPVADVAVDVDDTELGFEVAGDDYSDIYISDVVSKLKGLWQLTETDVGPVVDVGPVLELAPYRGGPGIT